MKEREMTARVARAALRPGHRRARAKPVADADVPPLWRALDFVLDAYALTMNDGHEVANLAIDAALAIGDRLGLSETTIMLMAESAAAEKRHARRGRPRRLARRSSK
jgi:hypothetical protein